MHDSGSRFFCHFPFEHLEIKADGRAFVCCSGRLPEVVGNLRHTPIYDLWNGPRTSEIRRSILAGTWEYCQGCRYFKEKFFHVKPWDAVTTREKRYLTEPTPDVPRRLVLAIDRSCQLSCPSCRTKREVATKVQQASASSLSRLILEDPSLPRVQYIWMSGSGDPLFSQVHQDMLHKLCNPAYKLCKVGLHTNGLLFKKWWEAATPDMQSKIKRVSVSVDAATPGTYEVNRRGGSWKSAVQNLSFIGDLREQGLLERFKMLFVVQRNNWREMEEFAYLAESLGADKVVFSGIRNWGTFPQLEYNDRAVHRPEHVEHGQLRKLLEKPLFSTPFVKQQVLKL